MGTHEEEIRQAMAEMGLLPRLTEPFFYGESMDGKYKDLSKVAKKFRVDVEDIVKIGDSRRDRESAQRYGSRLVMVPNVIPEFNGPPAMPMDAIGNLDELLKGHKAARFFYADGTFQHVVGDYAIAETG